MERYVLEDKHLNIYNLEIQESKELKTNNNKEIMEQLKSIYPQISKVILTYLEKTELVEIVNEERFLVEIPKDMIKELIDGTAEFMTDSEGKILPSIRDKQSKSILRQVRLKLLDDDKKINKEPSNKNLDNLNNMLLHKFMEKIYEEVLDIKETVSAIRVTQKNSIYGEIESGIQQYVLSKEDSDDIKKLGMVNARQSLSNGINDLVKEIKTEKEYFNNAMSINYFIRAIRFKKYSVEKLMSRSKEFDKDVKYLLIAVYSLLEIEKELGNYEKKRDNILSIIEREIEEIENSNICSIMPYSLEREITFSQIKNFRNNDILQLEQQDSVLIDVKLTK